MLHCRRNHRSSSGGCSQTSASVLRRARRTSTLRCTPFMRFTAWKCRLIGEVVSKIGNRRARRSLLHDGLDGSSLIAPTAQFDAPIRTATATSPGSLSPVQTAPAFSFQSTSPVAGNGRASASLWHSACLRRGRRKHRGAVVRAIHRASQAPHVASFRVPACRWRTAVPRHADPTPRPALQAAVED